MSYLCFDLETTTKKMFNRVAHYRYNEVVAMGYACLGHTKADYVFKKDKTITKYLPKCDLLLGHNIKFDLLYLWNEKYMQDYFTKGGKIWDTQLAEYLISGQQTKFAALRKLANEKYGCPKRPKLMESYWDKHVDTKDIPIDLVLEDVTNDVKDTEQIYLKQRQQKMLPLIEAQMDGLLATTEMEFNGMYVNLNVLKEGKKDLEKQIEQETYNFKKLIANIVSFDLNFDSPKQVSLLFFGGSYKVKEQEVVVDCNGNDIIYKSGKKLGQVKTCLVYRDYTTKGLEVKPHHMWKGTKEGQYSTDEGTLRCLTNVELYGEQVSNVANSLLNIRNLNKQLRTYYVSTEELVDVDSCVHACISHCGYGDGNGGTVTGRLSAKDPNIQNQPSSDDSSVKKHFTSRYLDGVIIEADYSQLDITVQAEISADKNYIRDIINGVDFHCKRLALKENMDYNYIVDQVNLKVDYYVKGRKKVKAFSFTRAFGGGIKKCAENSGMSEEEVKILIEAEEKEYPQLTQFNKNLRKMVEAQGFYKSITGRKYYFKKYPAPDWLKQKGIMESYKPTEIINYMVQGTATADIVLIMLGRFWRKVAQHHRDKFVLVNVVHDSIMLDCRPEYVEFAKNLLKTEMEQVSEMMKDVFNYNWKTPIKVDVKSGGSWYEC